MADDSLEAVLVRTSEPSQSGLFVYDEKFPLNGRWIGGVGGEELEAPRNHVISNFLHTLGRGRSL